MIFAVILAGGTGSRLKSSNLPKQFLPLGGKTVIQLTVEKFMHCNRFDKIVVALPQTWISYARDVFKDSSYKEIEFCTGGGTRQESLYNALIYIEKKYIITDDCIVVSHDAARPFVGMRILHENIDITLKNGAVDTVIPATDTIVESEDGQWVSAIPKRTRMFQGQTPQSFRIRPFLAAYNSLDPSTLAEMTDAVKILRACGIEVALVQGDPHNIKITYDYDIRLSNHILESEAYD